MAKAGRQTFEKRQREKNKKDKRQEKLERRNIRKADKEENGPAPEIISVGEIVPAALPEQE